MPEQLRQRGTERAAVAAEERGIIAGAARYQHDQARPVFFQETLEAFHAAQLARQGACERFRLLPDLVEHLGHETLR